LFCNATYLKVIIKFIASVCLVFYFGTALTQTYGLKFNGQDVLLDKRTELNLTPKGFIEFEDEFEISFDYKITRISSSSNEGFFGYIFRIMSQEDNNVDLLSTPTPEVALNLVIGKSNTNLPIDFPHEAINKWYRLRIKFLQNDDKLIFYTPDSFYVQNNIGFKKNESVKIIFGANDYKQFNNTDVPTMTVKDIEIFANGELKYFWPLNEVKGNVVFDKIKHKKAVVINPSWVVPNYYNWEKIFEDEISGVITVTADTKGGRIFIICRSELVVYNTQQNNLTKIKYNKIPIFTAENYRAIYNTNDNHVYCYLVDKAPYFKINVETGVLTETGLTSRIRSRFQQHNSYYNALDNDIYLFGGYGLHKYENKIRRLDLTDQVWEELPSNDSIFPPRYLAGLGSLNDTIYILGGYGSKSGNQLINPQNYFDFFGYSIQDKSLFRKFEIPKLMNNMVVGNSIWINKTNRNYYALVFNKLIFDNELTLIKGNLDSPNVEFVGDKIPFKFFDIRSFADLYYMPLQNKLIACTSYTNDSTTQIAFHAIDNPPVSSPGETQLNTKKIVFGIIPVVLLLLGLVLWRVLYNRKRQLTLQKLSSAAEAKSTISSINSGNKNNIENKRYHLVFFGGFQVFDKDFTDITNKFTPKLRELFLLILLNSLNNNKGISSDKITELLWFDKPKKSGANNRAVNIGKLRKILQEIGSCQLSRKTGYWKINLEDSKINSDYVDFLNIIYAKNNLTRNKICQLLEIIKKGPFLFNVHYDWLDSFKAFVSDTIIDSLVGFAKSCDIKNDADFIIHLTECIFSFDELNEDAMILKCKSQYHMGKHSHSLATYEKFFQEYLTIYGLEYDRAFLDILDLKK
jgi:two-component SAPR family response regulator